MSMVLVAGLLPCVVLLWYINKKDSVEKEPPRLLVKLIFLGCLSTIPAMLLELVGTNILSSIGMDETSYLYIFVENFFIVALAEEGCKKFMLRLGSWKAPDFNYVFDGVVYGVCVALGFAGLENVLYISGFGMEVAVVRGLAAVPLHAICGVFMGHFYGLEKKYMVSGMTGLAKNVRTLSMVIPVLIHGFYDFAASIGSDTFAYIWLGFIVSVDIIAINAIKQYSGADTTI